MSQQDFHDRISKLPPKPVRRRRAPDFRRHAVATPDQDGYRHELFVPLESDQTPSLGRRLIVGAVLTVALIGAGVFIGNESLAAAFLLGQ